MALPLGILLVSLWYQQISNAIYYDVVYLML